MTEIFRALATLAEPPTDRTAALVDLLDLGAPPTPSDYTDLFALQQPPYASAYLSDDGAIGGEASDRVAGFWRALGLTAPREADHLATMLGGYAELCERATFERDSLRRDALGRAGDAFLWEHLLSWIPAYTQAVERHAAPSYVAWARLLLDALLEQARGSSAAPMLSQHLRDIPRLPDPREIDPLKFLRGLLIPARSGMIVTRADLARAARTLGVGVRAGDRHLALRGLFAHDAPAVLVWLANEARTWNALHTRLVPITGPLAEFWAGRARDTLVLVDSLRHDLSHAGGRDVVKIAP
jgi:TorA maturation chaperone TorD